MNGIVNIFFVMSVIVHEFAVDKAVSAVAVGMLGTCFLFTILQMSESTENNQVRDTINLFLHSPQHTRKKKSIENNWIWVTTGFF